MVEARSRQRRSKRRPRRSPGAPGVRCARTPVPSNSPFIDETLAYWQPRSPRPLSREDARQIIENVSGFFSILLEWEAAERQCTTAANSGHKPMADLLLDRDEQRDADA